MTDFDDTFLPFALDIIEQNGTDAVFTVTDETYNRTTGNMTVNSPPEDFTLKISPPSGVELKMVDGDIVHVSDMQTIVAASGIPFTPERAQNMVWNETTWTIVQVRPIPSGDEIAAYKLIFRGN